MACVWKIGCFFSFHRNGRITRKRGKLWGGEMQRLLFSCEFLPHFFVETRSWMRTWVGKPHSRPRREMVLLSGILSRNVGSVTVQSWTGGFSSTGGKKTHWWRKSDSAFTSTASVCGWDQRGGGQQTWVYWCHLQPRVDHHFPVQSNFYFTLLFPVLGCAYCMFWNLALISNSLGQHPTENFKIWERDPHFHCHHYWNTWSYKDILKNQKAGSLIFPGFPQTLSRSVCPVLWKSHWAFRPVETRRENSRLSKLFHRTLAWANSLFLELDAVFCELFSNLRNGDRRAAKTTRGEIKLVLSTRNLCLLLGVSFLLFFPFVLMYVSDNRHRSVSSFSLK